MSLAVGGVSKSGSCPTHAVDAGLNLRAMLHLVSAWTRSMRCEIRRRAIQRRLLDVVARLPYEPESRVAYQHLVDDYMRLAQPARSAGPR